MKASRRTAVARSAFWPVLLVATLHARFTTGVQLQATAQMEMEHRTHQNPIRKVVKMLQLMSNKVAEQGERQEKLFDKYICYCKKSGAELEKQIFAAKEQIPQLASSLKETTAMHQQLTEDVKSHQTDRADSQEALDEANAIRAKEDAANTKDISEMKMNIKALGEAIIVVDKGMGSLLQANTTNVLKKLSLSMDMDTVDRSLFAAFLAQGTHSSNGDEDAAEYTPQSGEILGILKQLKTNMEEEIEARRVANDKSKANHESIADAKRKEIKAATKAIEEKMGRIGDLAVRKTSLGNELEDQQEGLDENSRVLLDLQKSCADKKKSWADAQTMLAEEKQALAETIKLLNDDEALGIFKKTLPSPRGDSFVAVSFLQVSQRSRSQALAFLRKGRHTDHRVALLAMALRGKKQGLDEVMKMIDNLVLVLRGEQDSDDEKKDNCNSEQDRLEDQVKAFDREIANTDTAVDEAKDNLAETVAQLEALVEGIKELDEQVAVATESRQQEHAEALETMAENNAAKSLLDLAKSRLHKFYNPKLKSLAERPKKMSQGDIIAEKFGVPAGPALAQAPVEKGPDLSYQKSFEEAGGVTSMIDLLRADLAKDNTQIQTADRLATEDHDKLMKNAAEKRAMDSQTLTDLESAKAEYESTVHDLKMKKKGLEKNHESTEKEIWLLHKDCKWLLENYKLRKEARGDEVDSLQKAKAVLAGASYT